MNSLDQNNKRCQEEKLNPLSKQIRPKLVEKICLELSGRENWSREKWSRKKWSKNHLALKNT